ncbi:MAG: MFS transporter [Thermofilaceae archaeon]
MGEDKRGTKQVLLIRQSLVSLADNLSAPYIGYYFASLSGSGTLQGILQMSVNSLPTVTQVIAGSWLDRSGKHVKFLLISSFAASLLWIAVSLTLDPLLLVTLITARAVVVGVAGLALTALVGTLFLGEERGKVLSYLNAAAQLCALPVFAIMLYLNPSVEDMRIFFMISGLISLGSSVTWLAMLNLDEKRHTVSATHRPSPIILQDKSFIKFTVANSAYTFAMAVAWPLFPLAQSYVLDMSVKDLAVLNVLSTSSTVASQYVIGKRIGGRDLKKLIVISRIGLVMFPTVYAVAHHPLPIYLWQFFSGPFSAMGMVAIPLYAMELADPEHKASYLAYLNLLQGVAASLGSAVGGVVTDRIIENAGWEGVRYGLALSAAMRTVMIILLLKVDSVYVATTRETRTVYSKGD